MKTLRWFSFLILVVITGAVPADALDPARALTQYQNDHWQTEDGLPQSTVQAITQTRDGYLWIGTLDGLARFDGAEFTNFDARAYPELGSGSVLGLMQDAEGNLWIGRSGGAVIYRDGKFRVAFGEDVIPGAVWAFCQGKDGAVWAATNNGLVRWEKGTIKVFHTADGLPIERLRSVACDTDGTLWIGTTGAGLVSYAGGQFHAFDPSNGFPHAEVRAVLSDPAGGVWAATAGGGLARVLGGKVTTYTVADGLASNQLSALARDAQGTLWIGTWGAGLSRMIAGHFSSLSASGGLAANQVWSLFGDGEGSLWVGTWVGGLNRLHDRRFLVFGAPEGLSHDNTRAVLHARDDAMWVATAGGGVNRIKDNIVTTFRMKDGLPSDETSSLFEDRDGSLWIGTNTAGLARLNHGRITVFGVAQGLPGSDVRAIHRDRAGTLWVATIAGLARSEGQRFAEVKVPGILLEAIVSIFEDHAGTLWFGTSAAGLIRLRDGQFHLLKTRDGLASNKVLSFHEDSRGTLWVGTGAGITRIRDDRMVSIRTSDGLWDGFAETILEDRAGNLWVTCNRGFYRVSRNELDEFAEGRRTRVTSVNYGASDTLRSTTFAGGQWPSGAVDSNGWLWLPSYKGLVIVDPLKIPASISAPSVRLEEVKANGVQRDAGPTVVFPPGPATLTIRYSAITLRDADRVHFRWRMEGLSSDWVDAGTQREALHPNLPYGHYRFQVIASADAGQTWSEPSTPLVVVVQPFFYQTTWFAVLVSLGGVFVVAGGLMWRLRQHRRREAELQARVNAALADVHTLQGMLPICAWCKKIRNDGGYWEQIEVYVHEHSAASFTHGICPDCVKQFDADKAEKPGAS